MKWVSRTVGVVLVATLGGFWVLDGIALFTRAFGSGFDVTVPLRVVSAVVCLSLGIVLEQSVLIVDLLTDHRKQIELNFRADVQHELSRAIDQLLLAGQIVPTGSADKPQAAMAVVTAIGNAMRPVLQTGEPLRSGLSVVAADSMRAVSQQSREIQSKGTECSLELHVAITMAMFNAKRLDYVQINQRAYFPETEWTVDWSEFIRAAGRTYGRTVRYVVYADRTYLESEGERLDSMHRFLAEYDVELLVCDEELVRDSLGIFTLERNIELFGDAAVKTHIWDTQGYRGGVSISTMISEPNGQQAAVQMARVILARAVPFRRRRR